MWRHGGFSCKASPYGSGARIGGVRVAAGRSGPAEFREALLALYFRLHSFRSTAGLYDERHATLIANAPSVKVRLFCLDPAFLLREALARGHAAVFFSATLAPTDYYRNLLGGAPEDPVLQLPSPFPA